MACRICTITAIAIAVLSTTTPSLAGDRFAIVRKAAHRKISHPIWLLRGKITAGCDRIGSSLPGKWGRVFDKARTIAAPAVTLKLIAKKGKNAPILGTYLVVRNVMTRLWLPIAMGAEAISPATGAAIFLAGIPLDLAVVAAHEHGVRKDQSKKLLHTLRDLTREHRIGALHQQYLNRLFMRRHRTEKTKGKGDSSGIALDRGNSSSSDVANTRF